MIFAKVPLYIGALDPRVSGLWDRVSANGVRSCFFETWSAFWFCSDEISLESKLELSASKIASALAIAYLDSLVDGKHVVPPAARDSLVRIARCWDDVAQKHFAKHSPWSPLIPRWISPMHGIGGRPSWAELPLLKNPFYPAAICTYVSDTVLAQAISMAFTKALGLLDDAADVVEDLQAGLPNSLLLTLPIQESLQSQGAIAAILQDETIERVVEEARGQLLLAQRLGASSGLVLFCGAIEELLVSLASYPEFCVAKLLQGWAQQS